MADFSMADIAAVVGNKDGENDMMGGGMIWVILLFFLFMGGDGFGGKNAASAPATQQGVTDSFNFNKIDNQLNGISNGICSSTYEISKQIAAQTAAAAQCCCETNRNIDAVRYENAQNTCSITTAIERDGDATRALINANTMQDLRDQLNAAHSTLAQEAQSRFILDSLGHYATNPPCPRPCCGEK